MSSILAHEGGYRTGGGRSATSGRAPYATAVQMLTTLTLCERRIYQAILERNPAQIIPRVKEELAKADPALGFHTGELRFWLGWSQELAGDHAAAQESWRQARSELDSFLKEQPDNWQLIDLLALTSTWVSVTKPLHLVCWNEPWPRCRSRKTR